MKVTKAKAHDLVDDLIENEKERDVWGVKHTGYLSPEAISRRFTKNMLELKHKEQDDFKQICEKLRHENPNASPERL
jgi:hypothetical protein